MYVVNNTDELKDVNNAIIICNDSQIQLKGNKLLTELTLNKRHKNISIVQCEQYTQNTDFI